MRVSSLVIVMVSMVFSSPSMAQAANVLKGNQITEKALVEALAPPPATRSIRPGSAPAAAAKPPAQGLMITFQTNSAELTADGKQKLDIVGRALNTDTLSTFAFQVEGHADPRGSPDWNLRLSQERADAVRQYLVQAQNVSANRLKPVGKGDREPLNTENPAAAENRRVTIVTIVQ